MGSVPCQGEGSSPSRVSSLCLIPHIPTSTVMAVGHAWRRPRMKVYDYNQEFGGNYYQPMIQYINHKNIYGPFSRKADVYLPHGAEVTSAKYTNMRYNDKSSAKHNLDQFLVDAHKTQIKELNGTTAMARVNLMKNIVTVRLLKGAPGQHNCLTLIRLHRCTTDRTVQYSTILCSTVQNRIVQYSRVQYYSVQYSTVQYSTVSYSEVQYTQFLLPTEPPGLCSAINVSMLLHYLNEE